MIRQEAKATFRPKGEGFALILVLILVAVASIVGVSYMTASSVDAAGAKNFTDLSRANGLAYSALIHGSDVINRYHQAAVGPTYGPYQLDGFTGVYSFSINWLNQTHKKARIVATGRVGGIQSTLSQTVTVSLTYPELVMSMGPMAYWRMGDSTLTAVDQTGGHPGTYMGSVVRGQTGGIVGDSDKAAQFNAPSLDYVSTGSLNVAGLNALSITAWVYADPYAFNEKYIFAWKGNTGVTFQLKDQTNLRVYAFAGNGAEVKVGPVPYSAWVFVSATYNGVELKLYMNGNEIGAKSLTGAFASNVDMSTYIGIRGDTTRNWRGKLDEVAIFNKALTAAQIKDLYDKGTTGQ